MPKIQSRCNVFWHHPRPREIFSHDNGMGGSPFSQSRGGNHVESITIWSFGNSDNVVIVAACLTFDCGTNVKYGCDTKNYSPETFVVPYGDKITKAIVHSGRGTYGIQFGTENGVESILYGGTGTRSEVFMAEPGEELCGMVGRCGNLIDCVIFTFGKHIHVQAVHCSLVPLIEIAKGTGVYNKQVVARSGTEWIQGHYESYNEGIIRTYAIEALAKVVPATVIRFSKVNEILTSKTHCEEKCGDEDTLDGDVKVPQPGSLFEAAFVSALGCTHSVRVKIDQFEIDTKDNGCYLYVGFAKAELTDGNCFTMHGDGFFVSSKCLSQATYKYC